MTPDPLLAIEDLSLTFGPAHVLDRVSLAISPGETLGLVGESGSGKSVTALAVMGLLDRGAIVSGGAIRFDGEDLIGAGEARLRALRGRRLAMVFQQPRRALNPARSVGRQITDVLHAHTALPRRKAIDRALLMLRRVGIPDPKARFDAYPFQLSGGLCQRVTIALALAASPAVLIADEPTTGLDVTTQAMALDLLAELAEEQKLAVLLITHDLALASQRCDRIAVMHAGQVVETAPALDLVRSPSHPYTRGLIDATPRPDVRPADVTGVPGTTPDLEHTDLPACRFLDRCSFAMARCADQRPSVVQTGVAHRVACWAAVP